MLTNEEINQYVVHSFSIGAYYWGEILAQLCRMDPERTFIPKVTGVVRWPTLFAWLLTCFVAMFR